MTILSVPGYSGPTVQIRHADRRSLGYLPSHTQAVSLDPEAYCLGVLTGPFGDQFSDSGPSANDCVWGKSLQMLLFKGWVPVFSVMDAQL